MRLFLPSLALVSVLVGAAVPVEGRYVFVLPPNTTSGNILIYTADPLAQVATLPTVAGASKVLMNHSATRAWVFGQAGSIQVIDLGNPIREVTRYSLGSNIAQAALTPDGNRLLVLAGELRVLNTTQDTPTAIPSIPAGGTPVDVAPSIDSSLAFVVSGLSRQLTVVDLATGSAVATQTFAQVPTGVTVAPNGLVYVSATNRLFELDYRNGIQFVKQDGFQFDAEPSKPVLTPNGQFAVMLNQQQGGAVGVISVDLRNRTVATAASSGGQPPRNLVVTSNTTAFATNNEQLQAFSLSPVSQPGPAALGVPDGVLSLDASEERASSRFLFGMLNGTIYRVELTANNLLTSAAFGASFGLLSYASAPSTAPVTQLQSTTLEVPNAPGAQSYPVAVRAVDGSGRPVRGATITFSTSALGMSFSQPTAVTNGNGIAFARATVPGVTGNYVARATSANGVIVDITVRVEPAATIGQTQFSILSGNGQIITAGGLSQPFQVRLRDAQGNAIVNQNVNWSIKAGPATLVSTTTSTDANGVAQAFVNTAAFVPSASDAVRPITVSAAVATTSFTSSLDLFGVIYPNGQPIPVVSLTSTLGGATGSLVLPAGAVIAGAFRAQVNAGITGIPVPMPNVGMRAFLDQTNQGPTASCANNPLTNAAGAAVCDLVVGTNLGNATLTLIVGESSQFTYTYPVRVIPGVPARLVVVQGDGQTGTPGSTTPRALVVRVEDAQGNILPDVPAVWTVVSGDAQIVSPVNVSDREGRLSALVRFGSAPGNVVIRVATEGLTATFTLINDAPIGTFVIVSGNNQTASIGTAFPQPLVVRLTRQDGSAFSGATVQFAVASGPVTIGAPSAVTDAQGQASVTVTAGAVNAPAQVTARFGSNVLTFTLTVAPQGPTVTGLFNGASFLAGGSPCAIGTVRGSNITNGVAGSLPAGPMIGPLPLTVNGVSVRIGGAAAPIFSVSNLGGQEQINIQVPCEIAAGSQPLAVTVAGQTSTVSVSIASEQPGIFETRNTLGVLQGILTRANGTLVTPESPALANEVVTGYFTGLGAGSPAIGTNLPGLGQTINPERVIIGINNQGVPPDAVLYAPNLIGVYQVRFTIPPGIGTGNSLPFAVAVNVGGQLVFGQGSSIPVRAQ